MIDAKLLTEIRERDRMCDGDALVMFTDRRELLEAFDEVTQTLLDLEMVPAPEAGLWCPVCEGTNMKDVNQVDHEEECKLVAALRQAGVR